MIPFVRLLCNAYRVRVRVCYPFGLFEIFFFLIMRVVPLNAVLTYSSFLFSK